MYYYLHQDKIRLATFIRSIKEAIKTANIYSEPFINKCVYRFL